MHQNARVYDLETGWLQEDVNFWRRLVAGSHPALEEARKHRADARLAGIDISGAMLAAARERVDRECPELRGAFVFAREDMRCFELGEQFDLVICGLNSLQYLYSLDDRLACLAAVRKHIAPGGRFAFDMFTPVLTYIEESSRAPVERLDVDLTFETGETRRFIRRSYERYDPSTQIDDTVYEYEIVDREGGSSRFSDSLRWYFYFPQELELLLRVSGFRVVERWGGYCHEPFDRRAMRYCWVVEVADN